MHYYIKSNHPDLGRPDFQMITLEDLNNVSDAQSLYIGDALNRVENPEEFLANVKSKLAIGGKGYVEQHHVESLLGGFLCGEVSLDSLNTYLFSSDYKRLGDIHKISAQLMSAGLTLVCQDIDNGKFLIEFTRQS